MSIDFDSKLVYGYDDDEYIKTKIKTYAGSLITNFQNKEMPKEKVLEAYEKYHPETFLEECKYVFEKIKTKNYIDEELNSDSDSNDERESDTDTDTNNNE